MASVESMLRFKEKDRQKNKKVAFTVAWMKFLLNFQAQKTTQERIIVERFSSWAPSTNFTPETLHAVISVIHEKVYGIIQIEFSRKKLESSTSVAAVYRRPKLSEKRDKVFYRFGGAAPNRVIKPRKQSLTPELCILTPKLAGYVATHIQTRGGSLNPPPPMNFEKQIISTWPLACN